MVLLIAVGIIALLKFIQTQPILAQTTSNQSITIGLSTATNGVAGNIYLGHDSYPTSVAYDPINGYMYVTEYGHKAVAAISPKNNAITTEIAVSSNPVAIAVDKSNGYIYIANPLNNTVSIIDAANGTVISTIRVGRGPDGITRDSINNYTYVSSGASDVVSVVSGNAVIHNITVGVNPGGILFDQSNKEIYVLDYGTVNPTGCINNINNGVNCSVSVISPASNSEVSAINTGRSPSSIVYDNATGSLYVANEGSNTISIIKNNSVSLTISTYGAPSAMAYDPANNNVYVVEAGTNRVLVLSTKTNTIISNMSVGQYMFGLDEAAAYDPSNGYIYIANYGSGTVTVLTQR